MPFTMSMPKPYSKTLIKYINIVRKFPSTDKKIATRYSPTLSSTAFV